MEKIKLIDICEKIGSGSTPRGGKEAYCDDGITLIRSQNILDYVFSPAGLVFITDRQAEKLKNVIVEENDILLNITGDSVARACIVDCEYLPARVNQHVCILRVDSNKVISSYLLYYLQMNKILLLQLASGGATRNALTKEMICNLEIDLPPLDEQKRIVAIIDDIQSKIMQNNKINENLEQQAQAVFKAWFIDKAQAKLPDNWHQGTFSELVESTLGGDWGKEQATGNYTEMVYCIRGADIPEVNAGNKGKMPTRYILPKNYASKKLEPNDIVVEISGGSPTQSTGRAAAISVALLNRYENGMVCTNFCRALKPKQGFGQFFYYYWQYLYKKKVFFSYENGTTGIKNLNLNGFLENETIVIPSIQDVYTFNNVCTSFHKQIFENGSENEQLSTLRDTLLSKLMSGEIDVSNVTI